MATTQNSVTGDMCLDVWLDASALAAGKLTTSLDVGTQYFSAMLALPSGGIAAGAYNLDDPPPGKNATVKFWKNLSAVLVGSFSHTLTLPSSCIQVMKLVSFAVDGLALYCKPPSTVYVWLDGSAVLQGEAPIELFVADTIGDFNALPGGGIAVGVYKASGGGSVDVWPNLTAVGRGGAAPVRVPASGAIQSIAILSDGAIAAGTLFTNAIELWPDAASLSRGDASVLTLHGSGGASPMLALPGGGLVAAASFPSPPESDSSFFMDVWPDIPLLLQAAPQSSSLPASGMVLDIVPLKGGGMAVGTGDQLDTSGTVDVWMDAAQLKTGEPAPIRLPASSHAETLISLPSGGLAVGTFNTESETGTIDVWPTVTDVVHGRRPAKVLELGFRVWSLVLSEIEGAAPATDIFSLHPVPRPDCHGRPF